MLLGCLFCLNALGFVFWGECVFGALSGVLGFQKLGCICKLTVPKPLILGDRHHKRISLMRIPDKEALSLRINIRILSFGPLKRLCLYIKGLHELPATSMSSSLPWLGGNWSYRLQGCRVQFCRGYMI